MSSFIDSLLARSPFPTALLGPDRSIVGFNRRFIEMTGLTRDSLKSRLVLDIIDKCETSGSDITSGDSSNTEQAPIYRTKSTGGEAVYLRMHEIPFDQNISNETLVLFEDVTEMINLRDENLHMAKLASVGKLVSFVVHEIGNFISVIKGCSEIIAGKAGMDDSTREEINRIRIEAERISEITKNVLGFARKDDNGIERISSFDLVHHALELKKYSLKRNRISCLIKTDKASRNYPIVGNRTLLMQVLLNLIDNAEGALRGQSRREIRFGLERQGESICIAVADTGPGIPETRQDRIFDAFYTTKKDGGTGLGLSISKRIIQNHGGDLVLDRSSLEEGTVFKILLPSPGENSGEEPEEKEQLAG